MRPATACAACRSRQRRCEVPPKGDGRCNLCISKNLPCFRPGTGALAAPRRETDDTKSVIVEGTSTQATEFAKAVFLNVRLRLELVELYFRYIHDQFHSLFHRPSFMDEVQKGTAPPVIVYGMIALSARFCKDPVFESIPPTRRAEVFEEETTKLLNLRHVNLTTLQACVLLGAVCITCGEAYAESVFYSAACRIANCLDLGHLDSQDPVEREINIRVYWTLCMIDVWSSDGIHLPRQMTRHADVPYPTEELAFLATTRGQHRPIDSSEATRGNSMLAQMIRLNLILSRINDHMEAATSYFSHSPSSRASRLESSAAELARQLDGWERALPGELRDTRENLLLHASRGLGRIFLAIYLGYHHFGQLLFYECLDRAQRDPGDEEAARGAGRCKRFAHALSRAVDTAGATPGCDVRYSMVGHITVMTSSVLVHNLLFSGDEGEIKVARAQLARNFGTLVELRKHWPMLELCFARLRRFQDMCRETMDTSFRMDGWMLRFLTEFAKPIEDREKGEVRGSDLEPWSLGDFESS